MGSNVNCCHCITVILVLTALHMHPELGGTVLLSVHCCLSTSLTLISSSCTKGISQSIGRAQKPVGFPHLSENSRLHQPVPEADFPEAALPEARHRSPPHHLQQWSHQPLLPQPALLPAVRLEAPLLASPPLLSPPVPPAESQWHVVNNLYSAARHRYHATWHCFLLCIHCCKCHKHMALQRNMCSAMHQQAEH